MSLQLKVGQPNHMGARYDREGTNFAVFSANATAINLCIFSADGQTETARVRLPERTGHVWHGYDPGLKPGTLYGFRAEGIYAPELGHRPNSNKLLMDPYTRELRGTWKLDSAKLGHKNGAASQDLTFEFMGINPVHAIGWNSSEVISPYSPSHRGFLNTSHIALACFGTHDTPTLNGFAKGRDIDWWHKLSWIDGETAGKLRKNRNRECVELAGISTCASGCESPDARVEGGTGSAQINHSVHKALAASSVAIVSVQLDDIEGQVEAQNLPGTIDEHPNWRCRSVTPVEKLQHHPMLRDMGRLMPENGRDSRTVEPKENAQ